MLREKKAQTQRVKKTYNAHDGALDDRDVQSSPIAPRERSGTSNRRVTGMGGRQSSLPKEMGMKEMEQHLSKINKQNFDLKLEVFHRRQRNEMLEAKVERMEALEADNAEMQSINEDLLLELEKRDVAIQEAVNLICELEAKIEEMGEAEMYFRNSTATPRAVIVETKAEEGDAIAQDDRSTSAARLSQDTSRPNVSPTRSDRLSPKPESSARRIPSFLREKRKSTDVLRSLYSYDGSNGPLASAFGEDDEEIEEDGNMISSPRLSILSESGFMSVYGDLKDSDHISPRQSEKSDIPRDLQSRNTSPRDVQREARVQKWVEGRDRPTTPTRAPSKSGFNDRFSSIGEVLEKVPSAPERSGSVRQDSPQKKARQTRSPTKSPRKEAGEHQRRPSSPAFGGPMFGGAVLPPTPGTMSTATIAESTSTPSIVTEKSLLDGTPLPAKGYSALIPDGRPRSSESNLAIRLGNALAAEESDQEPGSPRSNRSAKAVRPSLTTSATDTVFSGDGYATIQPSRTLSYPSPRARVRRPSGPTGQLSPTSEKSVGGHSSTRSHNERRSTAVTPTKADSKETPSRSPPKNPQKIAPAPAMTNSPADTDIKSGRAASFRSKINKISLAPSQSTQKSVASRLFRRANTNSTQAPPSNQTDSPLRPPLARQTSTGPHARTPRPSSLYGSSPIYGQRPLPQVPSSSRDRPLPALPPNHNDNHQHYRERERTCNTHRNYHLSSLLPQEMLTNSSDSASRYSR